MSFDAIASWFATMPPASVVKPLGQPPESKTVRIDSIHRRQRPVFSP
jgi:hypothetical protein